jgi:hypothetical protein
MYYSFLALFLVVPAYAMLRLLKWRFTPKKKDAVETPSADPEKEWVPGPKAILAGKIFDCFSEALLLPCFGLLGVALIQSFALVSGGALKAIAALAPVLLVGFFFWLPTYMVFLLPSVALCPVTALFPKFVPHVRLVMFSVGVLFGFYPDALLNVAGAIMGHHAVETIRGAGR